MRLWLFFLLCRGGDLFDFIEAAGKQKTVVPDRLAYQYFSTLMNAIAFLHSQGIIHRDIKPENTLVGDYLVSSSLDAVLGVKTPDPAHLKLTDFGYVTRFVPGQKHSRQCGTPRYESPEMLNGEGAQYSETVNLWAAMVTYFVLLVQSFPFAEMDSDFYLGKISKKSEYKRRMLPHMQQFFDRVFSIHATENPDYFTAHTLMKTLEEYRRLRSRSMVATSDPQPESPVLPLQPGIAIPLDKQSEILLPASVGSPAASSARRASDRSPQFLHDLSQAQQSLL